MQTLFGLKKKQTSVLVQGNAENTVLHRDDTSMVTPSWLTVNQSRYAIRTIAQLDFREIKPRIGIAVAAFFMGLVLITISVYHLQTSAALVLVLWTGLIISVGWTVIAAWRAFLVRPYFRVGIVFLDGSRLSVKRSVYSEARKLLDGITAAMDWHRNDNINLDANRASHVRRRIATNSGIVTDARSARGDQASNDEHLQTSGPIHAQEKRRQGARVIPFLAGLFGHKDR